MFRPLNVILRIYVFVFVRSLNVSTVLIYICLVKAIRDGNKVWGVVATRCNQDGRMITPMTAPSGEQQVKLLNWIYTAIDVDPGMVDYIEAHGKCC
jgi:phthiocerol/phenolphthiocerol synthesis type-I polyketide synthase D